MKTVHVHNIQTIQRDSKLSGITGTVTYYCRPYEWEGHTPRDVGYIFESAIDIFKDKCLMFPHSKSLYTGTRKYIVDIEERFYLQHVGSFKTNGNILHHKHRVAKKILSMGITLGNKVSFTC